MNMHPCSLPSCLTNLHLHIWREGKLVLKRGKHNVVFHETTLSHTTRLDISCVSCMLDYSQAKQTRRDLGEILTRRVISCPWPQLRSSQEKLCPKWHMSSFSFSWVIKDQMFMFSPSIKYETKPVLKWIHPSLPETAARHIPEQCNGKSCSHLLLAADISTILSFVQIQRKVNQALNTLQVKHNACDRQCDIPQMSLSHCHRKNLVMR